MLLKQNLSNDKKLLDDEFFSSFKIEKYLDGESAFYDVDRLKIKTPSKPQPIVIKDIDDYESFLKDSKTFFAVNKNTGGLYMVESAYLSKYYRSSDVDSVYKKMIESIKPDKDSLMLSEEVMVGAVKGKIYSYKDTTSGNNRKIKMWLNGDQFFYQSLLGTNEEINGLQANEFFAASQQTSISKPFDIKGSKAEVLLSDLFSTDSVIFKPAFGALGYYDFDKSEIPLIQEALKLKYPSDTIVNGVREKLIEALVLLEKKNCIPLLKNLFNDPKNTDLIRSKALTKVVSLDSTQYDWYLKSLLETKPLILESYWTTFKALTDSLDYVAQNFDRVLLLKKIPDYKSNIVDLVSDMSVSEHKETYAPLIKAQQKEIFSSAIEDLNKYLTDKEKKYPLSVYAYLNILPMTDLSKIADELTDKLIQDSISYMKTAAIVTRIKMNLPLNQKVLEAQLDSLSSRYAILNAFNTNDKLASVPTKYTKHDEIAKLMLYNYLGDDEDYPEDITLIGNIESDKGKYYVFSFSYSRSDDDEKKYFMGVCGPFDQKSTAILFDSYRSFSEYETVKPDWQAQAKKLLENMDDL